MYRLIVDEIVNILRQRGDVRIDDIKDFISLAMNITEDMCHWTPDDYNNMFDDVLLTIDHPGEKFIEPLN